MTEAELKARTEALRTAATSPGAEDYDRGYLSGFVEGELRGRSVVPDGALRKVTEFTGFIRLGDYEYHWVETASFSSVGLEELVPDGVPESGKDDGPRGRWRVTVEFTPED